ncbi:unnamed protein product [Musa textilis]
MATSSRRSSGPVLPFRRSISPRGGGTASAFASSSSSFTAHSPASFFHHRSASPTRVHFVGASPPPTPSVRLSFDRSTSPGRSLAAPDKRSVAPAAAPARRTCLCSPSTHPGSFRCSLHKGLNLHHHGHVAAASPSNRLNARRSAMTNSLVRIGAVEGEWVKSAPSLLSSAPPPTSSGGGRASNPAPAASPGCPRPTIPDPRLLIHRSRTRFVNIIQNNKYFITFSSSPPRRFAGDRDPDLGAFRSSDFSDYFFLFIPFCTKKGREK